MRIRFALLLSASFVAGGVHAEQPGRELLALTKFAVGDDVAVDLATYRLPEGAVCQEYVGGVKRTGASWMVTKAELCSQPGVAASQGLAVMLYRVGDMTIQTLAVDGKLIGEPTVSVSAPGSGAQGAAGASAPGQGPGGSGPKFETDSFGQTYIDWPVGAPIWGEGDGGPDDDWSDWGAVEAFTSGCYKDEKGASVQAVYDRAGRVLRVEAFGRCGTPV